VDDQYLTLGVAGMAAAGEPFMAHFGAALIAGWWLDRERRLSRAASGAMARQADALVTKHAWLFQDRPRGASSARCGELVEAVEGGLDHVWAIGRDVIYSALVVRTLLERPELADGSVIDGVLRVLASCREQPLRQIGGVFDVGNVRADEVAPETIENARSLADVTLRTMLEFRHVYYGLHQGDIGHLADHAHALLVLDRLGFHDAASRGIGGFREHLAALRRVRHSAADLPEVREGLNADPRQAPYWDRQWSRDDWAVGHVFKYPYAILDLLDVVDDETLAPAVLRRLGDLVVGLSR
jgi:hypothetical protein